MLKNFKILELTNCCYWTLSFAYNTGKSLPINCTLFVK